MKLREAAFFLAGMRARDGTARLDIGEEFGYFLSAFLSAARSVSFVLHKENPDTYQAIRDSWLGSQDSATKALAEDMVEHRNVAQKQGRLPAEKETIQVPWLALAGKHTHPYKPIQPWAFDGQATVGTATFQLELSSGREPVVVVCQRYLNDLEGLVALLEMP